MSTKQWFFSLSIVVVGGLLVLTIAGLVGKKYYDSEVESNPLLSGLGGLFKK